MADGGTEAKNGSTPDGAMSPSCDLGVLGSGGYVTFSTSADVEIVGATTLEFAINPLALGNVASFGCSVRTQVGGDFTEAFLRVTADTQQVAFHTVKPATTLMS